MISYTSSALCANCACAYTSFAAYIASCSIFYPASVGLCRLSTARNSCAEHYCYCLTHATRACVLVINDNQSGISVVKGKVFPYSLLSVGPGADPGVQAVSPQVT